MIYAILARAKNNLIGNGGSLPWKDDLKTRWDMESFKRLTRGNIVFMGWRTFLGFKEPLLDRVNVVETKKEAASQKEILPAREGGEKGGVSQKPEDFIFAPSLDGFLISHKNELGAEWKSKKIFIIGGAATIAKYAEKIDVLYLTTFFSGYEGNVYLPQNFLDKFTLDSTLEAHENGKIEIFKSNCKKSGQSARISLE